MSFFQEDVVLHVLDALEKMADFYQICDDSANLVIC